MWRKNVGNYEENVAEKYCQENVGIYEGSSQGGHQEEGRYGEILRNPLRFALAAKPSL